jgi:hypothetical protein
MYTHTHNMQEARSQDVKLDAEDVYRHLKKKALDLERDTGEVPPATAAAFHPSILSQRKVALLLEKMRWERMVVGSKNLKADPSMHQGTIGYPFLYYALPYQVCVHDEWETLPCTRDPQATHPCTTLSASIKCT